MSKSNRRLRVEACFHESGHALCLAATGGRVHRLQVTDGGGGSCTPTFPASVVDQLAVVYGGEYGKYYGTFEGGGDGTSGDAARLAELTARLAPGQRAEILAAAEARARSIVSRNLAALTHLANVLDCVGELDEQQVADILGRYGL